jgi:hypothetical protein
LGQKSLGHKDLRQKDFSRFSAFFAQRKRGFLSFLPFRPLFEGCRQPLWIGNYCEDGQFVEGHYRGFIPGRNIPMPRSFKSTCPHYRVIRD